MRLVTEHLDPWLTDTGTKVAIELGTCTQIDHDVARACRDYYCAKHSTNQLLLFKTTDNPKYFSTYRCNENVLPSHWHAESLLDHRRSIHINIPYSNRREIRTYISFRSPHTQITCHQQTIHRLSTLSVVATSTSDEHEYVTTRHKLTTST